MRRLLSYAALFALCASFSSCVDPEAETARAEQMVALNQGIINLQSYVDDLQFRIDSLKGVIASQDTAINRITEFVGLVLPGRERR